MARFSKKMQIVNRAGGKAYKLSDKEKLATILLSSFLGDQYYRSADSTAKEIRSLVPKVGFDFASRAAIYARDVFNMRSTSHVVAGEIAETYCGHGVKSFFQKVIVRPDDMSEIMCYWKKIYGEGRKYPNVMVKAFAKVLEGLDEYRVGKYKMESREMKLVDLVRICRPRANEILTDLVFNRVKVPDTWETKISAPGADKQVEWTRLVMEDKLGYMALIRNLRNIETHCTPATLAIALEQLTDPEKVHRSRLLPFRFAVAADQNLSDTCVAAIGEACSIAVDNCPEFDARTCVILDVSGSMGGYEVKDPACLGSLMGAILARKSSCDLMVFGNYAEYRTPKLNQNVLEIAKEFRENSGVGHGTNMNSVFQTLNKAYDRLIILSDMQTWIGPYQADKDFRKYCRDFSSDPIVYSFDLAGYGDTQMKLGSKVALVSGFSEKVFDLMADFEKGGKTLVDNISDVVL